MNELDKLMQRLSSVGVVAFVRNCEVATLGSIPARFNYVMGAAVQYTRSKWHSHMYVKEAKGASATEALKAAIQLAIDDGCEKLVGFFDEEKNDATAVQSVPQE